MSMARMHGASEVLGWSFPLFRIRQAAFRVSWLLPVWMVFDAIRFSKTHQAELIPFAFIVPPVAMLLHSGAHWLGCRLVGGTYGGATLSVLNNYDAMQVPLRPWAHLCSGLAGPLANFAVAGTVYAASFAVGPESNAPVFLGWLIIYIVWTNLFVGFVNLLACQPFDGHRWWRGLLWQFLPMAAAVHAALMLGFISAILLIVFGAWQTDYLCLFMGICSLMMTISDKAQIAAGQDPVFLVDPAYAGRAPTSNWARQREERRQERLAREESDEQEVLDRLLAKVSEHGLPSLTNAERKQLQRISQRQKDRAAGR